MEERVKQNRFDKLRTLHEELTARETVKNEK